MPSYLTPGVYLEEFAVGPPRATFRRTPPEPQFDARSVWEAEHGTSAFLGWASRGPEQQPTRITGWKEFGEVFGPEVEGGFMAQSVKGFFENGGRSAFVVRLPGRPGPGQLSSLVGDPRDRTGLCSLEPLDDVSLVVLPDLVAASHDGSDDLAEVRAGQTAAIAHCELMRDRVALLDSPPGLGPQVVRAWRRDIAAYDSTYAAMLWPWLHTSAPQRSEPIPPSGHVAGLMAGFDHRVGPEQSPVERTIRGVAGVAFESTTIELEVLTPIGVNALVGTPDSGVVLHSARTLSSDAPWRQLASRRVMAFLGRNLTRRTRWALAERPDDRAVWAELAHDVDGLLRLMWHAGSLDGERAEDAFAVQCDEEINGLWDQPGRITLEAWARIPGTGVASFRVLWVTA
ncbi:phage tail sheath protein FI [Agromyces ramosus]|uniref:Phage tail sheath protein FI n=1 Tax=Agromyces ramosus TaxID=33879 RepID=A0A4Q7M8H0_9MICO|nr:phage tail sheath protein FI [Agromyces ramosus]